VSVVYGARAETGGERAAVKILTLTAAKEWSALEFFDHGARVLMSVRHPGLPMVYDLSQDSKGRHILVREIFDGGTLEERVLRDGQHMEPAAFHRLFESLLGVVAYLHGLIPPVLHRDIKPSNIMFRTRQDADPVLVDFDTIALPPERRRGLTVVGTPGYAAPEQFYGESVPQSDLFGLAATMLCVATHSDVNALPRQGGRFQVEGRLGNLDPRARRVMMRLLEPDPGQRHQNAAEALEELRAGGSPVALAPATAQEPALDERGERELVPGSRKRPGLVKVVVGLSIGLTMAILLRVLVLPLLPLWEQPAPEVPTSLPVAESVVAEEEPLKPWAEPTPVESEHASSGLNPCAPVVPCYQEAEEFGQVAGRLEILIDARGEVTRAAYGKGRASAKVRRCMVKAAKALAIPAEAERPATHVCQWGGTLMEGSQIMSWDRSVLKPGQKSRK
jgi:hypothetical protein